MVVVDKERSCKIIDFAVPGDSRIEEKEKDKMENRLFENNQRQLYRELDQEEERCDDDLPVAEVNVKKQQKIDITTGSLKTILGRMQNFKSPGPGLVQ